MKNDSGSKFAFREVANVTTKPAKIPGSSPFHSDSGRDLRGRYYGKGPDRSGPSRPSLILARENNRIPVQSILCGCH